MQNDECRMPDEFLAAFNCVKNPRMPMKPGQTVANQTLDQLTRAAHQYRRQGRHDKFLELMERAAAMFPQKFEIRMELGLF
jgi:hypothetical protein